MRSKAAWSRMRRVLVAWLLVAGCREPAARKAEAPAAVPTPTHYLDEWFALGPARCRVRAAERVLTQQPVGRGPAVEDVFVVDTTWACEAARGHRVSLPELLPRMQTISWLDDRHELHLRVPATSDELARNHLRFAVPSAHDGLPRARKYDAQTGAPHGPRDRRDARLIIASAEGRVAIAPFPRLQDAALDRLLDQLALGLATDAPLDAIAANAGARASLDEARALFHEARTAFSPQQLALVELREIEGQPRLALALEPARSDEASGPAQRFEFELTGSGDDKRVLRLLDPESKRAHLACTAAKRALFARVDRRIGEGPQCNVAALLLPSRCEDVEPTLLADALRYGARCTGGDELRAPSEELGLPSDFEVRLVRGRAKAALERSPRYTLSIARSGEVRFLGEHWVSSTKPSAGRAPEPLLTALYEQILRLGWFDRPDPPERRAHCQDHTHGDVIRVVAGGRDRVVRDRDGCRAPFSVHELSALRRAIEHAGGVAAWTAPTPDGVIRDDQIWVVAAE